MADAPHVFSDRYEMVRHIARGGMAQVYLAQDLLLDRPVALKVLFPELSIDQAFVERFRREARAAANLSHPNIVSVYDWGQGDSTYYIVMEYVDGPTLSSMLKPRDGTPRPLEAPRAAAIAASVAAALDFAHRRGVIHRDVKPGNVLLDSRGQVKVADFGIARAVGSSEDLTQTGSVMGTATYFSPEQAQGFSVDPRSDVYSLGVVLYEMVTGKPPFSGENPVSIAYKHVKEPPAAPRSINPTVPPALEAIILKAMAKEPDGRYQSAEEMRADLAAFTTGQPVAAMAALAAATTVVGTVAGGTVAGAATRVQPAAAVESTTVRRRPPPPPERSYGWLYALIALLVALLFLAGYLIASHSGLFGHSDAKTLTVPRDLVGKPLPAAQSELAGLGFTNVKTTQQASSSVTANDVINSDPAGGSTMKSNAALTLAVSTGAVQVKVPDVTGQDQATADQNLFNAGFRPTNTPGYSATVGQGMVISTDPAAGTEAAQGAVVKVIVSNGQQPVQVPSVVGQSPAQAGATLAAAGLKVSGQQPQASTTVPVGQVTGTDPAANTTVASGSGVVVYVSTGAPTASVPSLVGQTAAQAAAALAAADLKGAPKPVAVTDPSQNGLVQSQSPSGGTTVPQGSTVQYQVGQYTPTTSTSTSSSTSTTSTTLGLTSTTT